jgi:hypothetical protein
MFLLNTPRRISCHIFISSGTWLYLTQKMPFAAQRTNLGVKKILAPPNIPQNAPSFNLQ